MGVRGQLGLGRERDPHLGVLPLLVQQVELARYLAYEYAQTFGLQADELQAVQQNAGFAEGALRFLRTRGPTYVPQRASYF